MVTDHCREFKRNIYGQPQAVSYGVLEVTNDNYSDIIHSCPYNYLQIGQ